MIDPVGRRTFLTLLGAAGSVTAVPAFAATGTGRDLVLLDARLTPGELRGVPGARLAQARTIGHQDVVRWRREVAAVLAQGGAVTAFTRWDMALLLADLGREAGRTPRRSDAGEAVEVTVFDR